MKLEVQKPNILRIAYHQEQGDPHYGSCLWAYFDFDLDEYMLNIQSDCGNAAYSWVATPDHESFLHLMSRINDDYLIHKLFREDEVDVQATVAEAREWLGIGEDEDYQQDDMTDEEREEREYALGELEELLNECTSEGHAYRILDDWNDDNDFGLDCVWERVVTDFTVWEKRIVQIFSDYIQPKIQELVREEDGNNGR